MPCLLKVYKEQTQSIEILLERNGRSEGNASQSDGNADNRRRIGRVVGALGLHRRILILCSRKALASVSITLIADGTQASQIGVKSIRNALARFRTHDVAGAALRHRLALLGLHIALQSRAALGVVGR